MEFLNNLWIAFSTPNETFLNVILFFAGFVETYIVLSLFLIIININSTNKQKIIYLISISLLGTLCNNLIPAPFNWILNYGIVFILIKFLFKSSFLKSIIGMASSLIIFGLIGFLILKPYLAIVKIPYEQLQSIPVYRIIYLLIIYAFSFFIIKLLNNFKLSTFSFNNFNLKDKVIIIFNFILGIITLCLNIWITFSYINTLPIIFSTLSFISLFAYFIISLYTLIKISELFKTTEALHNAQEYNKTLQIIHDSVRCFKHDFDNIVMTIGGYIHTNDMEGLKAYYSNLQEDCQTANNLYMLNPNVVNDPGIYNLLTNKYYKAENNNVKINFSFLLDFTKLNMNIYEFTRILGILTDNAIEAASECDEKIINISFRNEEKNNRQILLIENTYKDSGIEIEKLFDKGVSGKEKHTGIGLWEVRKIVKKHKNLNLYTNKNDKYFIQQLEIY